VRSGRQEKDGEERAAADPFNRFSERYQNYQAAQYGRERKRVRKSPVAEHVCVINAESFAHDIKVRHKRAGYGYYPETQRKPLRRVGAPQSYGCDGMGECGWHCELLAPEKYFLSASYEENHLTDDGRLSNRAAYTLFPQRCRNYIAGDS